MWIESHTNLARHPKTRRLMKLLGWSLPDTIGNLHLLWWWALEYAPTGDLTHFDPDQLTADLDLLGATPEQFIETMVQSGFLDREEDGVLCIHDWPEYKRPKPRRKSAGSSRPAEAGAGNSPRPSHEGRNQSLPVPPRREDTQHSSATAESDQLVGNALRAVRGITRSATAENETAMGAVRANLNFIQTDSAVSGTAVASTENSDTERKPANIRTHLASFHFGGIGAASLSNDTDAAKVVIPKSLAGQPGLTDIWWPKFIEMYKLKGCPLTDVEQRRVLERLERLNKTSNTAVQMLKKAVTNYVDST